MPTAQPLPGDGAARTPTRIPVPPNNNFDLLRFVFAGMVVLHHARICSLAPELDFLRVVSADLAVKAFFVVSGFLVFMSFEQSRSTSEYFGKRARRIYPAYVAVVVGAAILGACVTEASLRDYFSSGLARYLAANLVFANFLAPTLPGVFVHNPVHEVNGALWTIKIEVMFYLCVPVLAWLGARGGRTRVLAIAYGFGIAWSIGLGLLAARSQDAAWLARLAYQLPGQLGYFAAGALCYYHLPALRRHWAPAIALGVAGMLADGVWPLLKFFIEPASLALVVVYLAFGLRYLGNFARYGDLSYGVYICHVPILQTLVAAGAFERSPYGAFALAIALVLLVAFASWHLVEKPFLQRGSHYVLASRGA
jgi:peptidoglycan/LPS O-acetylase OafA/YrhL